MTLSIARRCAAMAGPTLLAAALVAGPALAAPPLVDLADANISAQTQSPFIGSPLAPSNAFVFGYSLGVVTTLEPGSGTAAGGQLGATNRDVFAAVTQTIAGPTAGYAEVDFGQGRTLTMASSPDGGSITTATADYRELIRFENLSGGVVSLGADWLISAFTAGPYPDGDFNISASLYAEGGSDYDLYLTYNNGSGYFPSFQPGLDVGTLVNVAALATAVDANNARFDLTFAVQPGISFLTLNGGSDARCFLALECSQSIATRLTFAALPIGLSVLTSSGDAFAGLPAATAVPEPATWAMLIFGFGAVSAMLRRRAALPST